MFEVMTTPEVEVERAPLGYVVPRATTTQEAPAGAPLRHPTLYFNQELSWIDFNWRVLHLALDERTPLLERVRFLAITASNLDEFVQKRVGGLKRQQAAGVRTLSPDGLTPMEQLALIRQALLVMQDVITDTWEKTLKPALPEAAGIEICSYAMLTPEEQQCLAAYFRREIYPILTPLIVDPGHPFPFISNLSLSLSIILRHPQLGTTRFARIKIPPARWLPLHAIVPDADAPDRRRYLPLEELVCHHVAELFPGMEIVSAHPFRITRNADVRRDEEEAEDLLAMISAELRERRFAPVVRMEVACAMPEHDRRLLIRELGLQPDDVYEINGLLNLADCALFAEHGPADQLYPPWEPVVPNALQHMAESQDTPDIFALLRQGDMLVHHPYESFMASVQLFVEQAAMDPQVLAIKQTLYRTSDESPIIRALIQAAERGKQVAVLVEVTARFDEANNIEWAQVLENAGVHVTYGVVGLKTHTKATLVIRRERDGLRAYCHIGTGNYHSKTARLYADIGLLTCDAAIGRDVVNLFHYLTGYAPAQRYERVLVAPRYMARAFVNLIKREMGHQQATGNGHIMAKMNALDDVKIIRRLYQASQAGVKVDLIVRGHCRLRPGVPGVSDNIRVISILGRFLEHDRIFYFHNNGEPEYYIGSADWRGRNLHARVELVTPISEPALQERLSDVLHEALQDNRLAWELHADGQYVLRRPAGEAERDYHYNLMRQATKRAKKGG